METTYQLIQQINQIISEQTGTDPEDISPASEFHADFNADSDTMAAITLEVEHLFGEDEVVFEPEEMMNLLHVKDLYDLTLEKLNEV